MQNDALSPIRLAFDNSRKRRQVAPTQAAIARAGRVAQALGPNWRLLIKGDVVELFQGEAPKVEPVAPNKRWRL
jgi:hypothetical protein